MLTGTIKAVNSGYFEHVYKGVTRFPIGCRGGMTSVLCNVLYHSISLMQVQSDFLPIEERSATFLMNRQDKKERLSLGYMQPYALYTWVTVGLTCSNHCRYVACSAR